MECSKTRNGSTLTIAISGRLDTVTAPDCETQIKNSLEGVTDLVLDLKELEYISSAGLRVLLSLQKSMNRVGTMVVRNVNEIVGEVFDVTGFTDVLTIEN